MQFDSQAFTAVPRNHTVQYAVPGTRLLIVECRYLVLSGEGHQLTAMLALSADTDRPITTTSSMPSSLSSFVDAPADSANVVIAATGSSNATKVILFIGLSRKNVMARTTAPSWLKAA